MEKGTKEEATREALAKRSGVQTLVLNRPINFFSVAFYTDSHRTLLSSALPMVTSLVAQLPARKRSRKFFR
jgi:hypothetical protein